jgi:hypothetical protein|tara:strand:- start:278 stop:499 length:222 start_codon:yes stop_codon:yes gene_type:complete
MKSIREKREMELRRIVKDLWKLKRNHDNNILMITYDYLYLKVRQMQKNGLLYEINIPSIEDYKSIKNGNRREN